jgi:hypothetical protein
MILSYRAIGTSFIAYQGGSRKKLPKGSRITGHQFLRIHCIWLSRVLTKQISLVPSMAQKIYKKTFTFAV